MYGLKMLNSTLDVGLCRLPLESGLRVVDGNASIEKRKGVIPMRASRDARLRGVI
jgi:hypothetical protein